MAALITGFRGSNQFNAAANLNTALQRRISLTDFGMGVRYTQSGWRQTA